jgi:protein XagA
MLHPLCGVVHQALPALSLAAVALLLASGHARGGAWTLPVGARQVIVTGTFVSGDRLFDARGRLVPVPEYRKFELTPFAEFGVTDWLTAIASTSLLSVSAEGYAGNPRTDRYTGPGYTELGARARLAEIGNTVLSAQSTVRLPGALDDNNRAEIGNTEPEFDGRLLGGIGFSLGAWPSFVDVQAAYRLRAGPLPNEARLDLTLGTRPLPGVLLLAQSFNVWGNGEWPGVYKRGQYHKLQGSVVVQLTPAWSAQLGLVGTVAGRNALRERGAILAAWAQF